MTKIHVVPASGAPLPYPGGVLPTAGDWVDPSRFWRRRVADGDVIEGVPEGLPADAPTAAAGGAEEPSKPAPRAAKK